MHLVANAFKEEIIQATKERRFSRLDTNWWAGYAIGLLTAGLLTQEEHDEAVNLISSLSED